MLFRRIYLLIILFGVSQYAFSQVTFGIKAGANVNTIQGVDDFFVLEDQHSNIGFHVGVFADIDVGSGFSLIPELQLSRRGHTFGDSRHNLDYIELPVLVSYRIKKVSFDIGPSVAYLISARSNGNNLDFLWEKNFDFGFIAGARYNITERISVVGRYYVGLATILEMELRDEYNNTLGKTTAHHRTGQVGIAYRFGSGDK